MTQSHNEPSKNEYSATEDIPVHWVIGQDSGFENTASLEEAVEEAGGTVQVVSLHNYVHEVSCRRDLKFAPVIVYGSLRMCRKIMREHGFVPGSFCDPQALRCASYYPQLGDRLFNREYVMAPLDDLERVFPKYQKFFSSEELFIRPDSPMKGFTGAVYSYADVQEKLTSWSDFCDDNALVVVSHPKPINREFRFIIVDGQMVAGSQYRHQGKDFYSAEIPYAVRAYAIDVLEEDLRIDSAFTIDIAELPGGELRVMEVNSFSSAGLYACDRSDVVHFANQLARRLYHEYHSII